MQMNQVELKTYPIQILTSNYMVIGKITPRGRPIVFLNDPQVDFFAVEEAETVVLSPGSAVATLNTGEMLVPRQRAQVIIFGSYSVEEARPLPKTVTMACLTDTYIVRGNFHMAEEVNGRDVFYASRGPFYPVTGGSIYSLRPLAEEIGGDAELVFLNGTLVETYYLEQE